MEEAELAGFADGVERDEKEEHMLTACAGSLALDANSGTSSSRHNIFKSQLGEEIPEAQL